MVLCLLHDRGRYPGSRPAVAASPPAAVVEARPGRAFCGGLILVDMYIVEPNWIAVERVTIRNARLAAVLGGVRSCRSPICILQKSQASLRKA